MALTQEEISKMFYGQGLVFDMSNPATLSRYTIMEKTGRRKYSPVTLDKILARDPGNFLATVEQNLRDGNVLCYDSRRDALKPTSLKLNDNNTIKHNKNFKDVPASVVPEMKFRFFKRIVWWAYDEEFKAYDGAVRRNKLRDAQLAHFDQKQEIERLKVYHKEEGHVNAIENARSAGRSTAPLRGFDTSEEFILQHPHLQQYNTLTSCRALSKKRLELLGKDTPVDPYDTDMDRPYDTKENVYSAALSRRPTGYPRAIDNPNPAPEKPRIPSILSGEFYMVLDSKKTIAGNLVTIPANYSKYINNIESMLDHDQPYPKKLLFEQNQGTKEMWTMCQTISHEITQNMQQLRELDGITDPDKQLAAIIPLERGGNASANLSVVDTIDVNAYCRTIIEANRERIRCLKELVVSVASNSSAITEENQQTLRECSTLSAFLEKAEDAFDKKQNISALKMEDSKEKGDREINALLASPEIVERMRPMEVRMQEHNARIAKEQEAERLEILRLQEENRRHEIENQRLKAIEDQRLQEENRRNEIEKLRQQEISRRNEEAKVKAEEIRLKALKELEEKAQNEKLERIRKDQERIRIENEEKLKKWKEEAPLRLATDQKLKEIWGKEDSEESTLIRNMTRYGIQNYANARLKKANDIIKDLQDNPFNTYEQEQILKHLTQKVNTVYAPLVKKYTDYSTAVSQDTTLMKNHFKQWKEDRNEKLSLAQTPSEKSQIDKSWRVDKVFGSKPDFVDLKENGCKVNIKNINKQVISAYGGISEIDPEMKVEERIVALNLCAAICAPYLPHSKTGKAFQMNKYKKPNELWIATGLLEGVLDGKKPPREINAFLPDALEDGRTYINEIFTQNDDLLQRNTAIMNILNRGASIMTEMLNTTLTKDPNSSWTIGAKYLNDIMRLRQMCDRYKHNATENLPKPVMAMAAGWAAAYNSHENNSMCTDIISSGIIAHPYLKTTFVVDGEVQNMCIKDYMEFENYKGKDFIQQKDENKGSLGLLNMRSNFEGDYSQSNIYGLGRFDPNLEKLAASCRKESDYKTEIERCKKERLKDHDFYEINKEQAIIDAKLKAESDRKFSLEFEEKRLAPRKPMEAPRKLQSTMTNQQNSARIGPDR